MNDMDQEMNKTFMIIIGKMAYEWLWDSETITVTGTTSSGTFLKTNEGRVVFLTTSNHYGPVNLIIENNFPQNWKNGDLVQVSHSQNSLIFNFRQEKYVCQIKSIWKTPPTPIKKISTNEQLSRINQAAQQLSILKNREGLASLLTAYMDKKTPLEFDSEWINSMWFRIQALREAIKDKNNTQIKFVANQLIGSGRGLTPSGDDLLSGLFFMHQRWFQDADWFNELKAPLIDQFDQKTTAVSSTLFYCATLGEADFRIQEMADVLMNDALGMQSQAINLARWGNSSGADIFLGLVLAMDCFQENQG